MKRYIIFLLFCALPLAIMALENYTVVIDAGHGGKDPSLAETARERD